MLHQHARHDPDVTPSRFSPVPDSSRSGGLDEDRPPLYPSFSGAVTPEDSAFLRRVSPILLRMRAARAQQQPVSPILCEHMALAAAVLAQCGKKLGEARYTQAAQRAVSFLISSQSTSPGPFPLPASAAPVRALHAQITCGASAALSLALLTLGTGSGMDEYGQSGLRLLGSALHAFVRRDGMVMHTPADPAAFFMRVPAVFDGELPSPAALLVHSLRIAHALRPQAHYDEAITAIWDAAAPAAHEQPLSCASLIDAMTAE